jgi:hypothetical protein
MISNRGAPNFQSKPYYGIGSPLKFKLCCREDYAKYYIFSIVHTRHYKINKGDFVQLGGGVEMALTMYSWT